MGCGCGQARTETITTNVAQQMIDDARRTAQEEFEAMIASAGAAMGNANSEQTAKR
jgi:hypothetical protein